MDKSKVKFILIVFAVVLAIVILYRLFSGVAESTVEKKKAQDKADAELYAQMKKDEYTDGREEVGKNNEQDKVSVIEEANKAQGIETLDQYLSTLPESIKKNYLDYRTQYIRVMDVDPGLMRYEDLSNWYSNYMAWKGTNDQYIRLTGQSLSILDPNYDTVEEVEAAIVTAQANIEEAKRQLELLWNKEYALFNNDRETDDGLAFKGVDFIPLNMLKKWLDNPMQLASLQDYLTGEYNLFVSSDLVNIKGVFNQLKQFWNDEGYIDWKSSAKSDTRGVRAFDASMWSRIIGLGNNGILYLNTLISKDGGWDIYYKAKSNGHVDSGHRQKCSDLASMFECAANFEKSMGKSYTASVYNQYVSYANQLRSITGSPTHFGFLKENAETMLAKYSQELYGLSDDQVKQIMNNKKRLSAFLKDVES